VLELDVVEIGASLRWATVTVTKATRTTGGSSSTVPADAWSTSPATPSGFADEPPF
jgi:single-strand DNA-binding protein